MIQVQLKRGGGELRGQITIDSRMSLDTCSANSLSDVQRQARNSSVSRNSNRTHEHSSREAANHPVGEAFKKQIEIRRVLRVPIVAALVRHEFVNRKDRPCRANFASPREGTGDSGEQLIPKVTEVRQASTPRGQQRSG
jgi:hypothetical protein